MKQNMKEKGKGWCFVTVSRKKREEFSHANYSSSFLFLDFTHPPWTWVWEYTTPKPNDRTCAKMITKHSHTKLVSNSNCSCNFSWSPYHLASTRCR